jgi:hypothetical protein
MWWGTLTCDDKDEEEVEDLESRLQGVDLGLYLVRDSDGMKGGGRSVGS